MKRISILTYEEARAQASACCQAMREELQRWIDLHAFERAPLGTARNLIDARWVLKWKVVDGVRRIKARLTVRGFRDSQGPALSTFSATTSRWGQRLIVSMAVQRRWTLFSCDIAQAFLRGIPFAEFSKMPGEVKRSVQFVLPTGSVPLLRALDGYQDFDAVAECLNMLRAGFGLKDAPRAWSLELGRVLRSFGLSHCQSDEQIWIKLVAGDLVLLISAHVDDLKGCGTPKEREAFLEHLRARFGKMTLDLHKFTHVGIEHEQDPKTYVITLSQVKYTAQLRTICLDAVVTSGWDTDSPPDLHSAFRTLVGGVAWLTLTAPAILVYVAFL